MTDLKCPACGTRGRKVGPVTIENLAVPEALAGLDVAEGFAYCPAPGCDVVWFHTTSGKTLGRADCRVRVGMKETEPPRPVCYCFEHTVEEIEAEIAATGKTDIPASIADKCRRGLDRCEETNPQGSCCLGNINRIVKAASPAAPAGPFATIEEDDDCCSP